MGSLKKYWVIFIPTLAILLQTVLSILPKSFKDSNNAWNEFSLYIKSDLFLIYICTGFFIVLLSLVVQLILYSRPIKRLEKVKVIAEETIDLKCNEIIENYQKQLGIDLRINVMLARLNYINIQFKPFKIRILNKRLRPVYTYKMDFSTDKALKFFTDQGICGRAFTNGFLYADLSTNHPSTFNLSENQINRTINLRFVMSIPLYEYDLDSRKLTNKKIGVVNFDTNSDTINRLLQNNEQGIIADMKFRIEGTSYLYARLT